MRAPQEAALEAVALRLDAAGVPFLLGGSALLDALGLEVEVRDVDLMLRPQDRAAFEAACAEWLVAVTTEPGEVLSSDWKATLDVDGVEVEGLGGLGFAGGARRARAGAAPARCSSSSSATRRWGGASALRPVGPRAETAAG